MDLPIFCTLTPETRRTRSEGLLAGLVRQAHSREELPAGLRFQFRPAADTLATIARVVEAERKCCRFLRFQVTIEPDDGTMALELTGPPGTREFVTAMLEG